MFSKVMRAGQGRRVLITVCVELDLEPLARQRFAQIAELRDELIRARVPAEAVEWLMRRAGACAGDEERFKFVLASARTLVEDRAAGAGKDR